MQEDSILIIFSNKTVPSVITIYHQLCLSLKNEDKYAHVVYDSNLFLEGFVLNTECQQGITPRVLKERIEKTLKLYPSMEGFCKPADETTIIVIKGKKKTHVIAMETTEEEEELVKQKFQEIRDRRLEDKKEKRMILRMIKKIAKKKKENWKEKEEKM